MKVIIHPHIVREESKGLEVNITRAEAEELYAQLFEVLFGIKPDETAITAALSSKEPITQDEIDAWLNDGGRDLEDVKPKESA